MKKNENIKRLANLKKKNPEEFERLVKDNMENNPEFNKIFGDVPMEKSAKRQSMTWLDKMLVKEGEMDEAEVMNMTPAEKVELFLNCNTIYGYTEDIIKAISTAYGVNLPV